MEHHSNIVPWHFLRERHGAVIKWAPVDDRRQFPDRRFEKLLTDRTKMVAITDMSNMLGTVVPVKEGGADRPRPRHPGAGRRAPRVAVISTSDDARHRRRFYVFTGHKLYGPPGSGAHGKSPISRDAAVSTAAAR